jgi:hypothetical protein
VKTTNKVIKLLPLLCLVIAAIILLFTGMVTNVVLMKEHILGIVLLAIAVTIQAFNTTMGYQATGLVLLISTFSFAAYTATIWTIGIGFITVDLFSTSVFLLYIVIHRNQLLDWILDLIYGNTPPKRE